MPKLDALLTSALSKTVKRTFGDTIMMIAARDSHPLGENLGVAVDGGKFLCSRQSKKG